jgi:hypothetical protein
LLNRSVILAEVVDAGILLRRGPGLDEIGNGDRRQKTNNSHDDHDFHQREAGFARNSDFHMNFTFTLCSRGVSETTGTLIRMVFAHGIACCIRVPGKVSN